MALAYTAPTWEDGSGTGISASQLQALSDCMQGLVQGSDKAIHSISFNNGIATITYADGSIESNVPANMKGISSIAKTGTVDLVDTYTVTYTDGTTFTYTVTNGRVGQDGRDGVIQYTAGSGITISDQNVISADAQAQQQADWDQADNTQVDYIKNKPDMRLYYATDDDFITYFTIGDSIPVHSAQVGNTGPRQMSILDFESSFKTYFDPMYKCLVLTKSSVSSIPTTISNAAITATMVCIKAELSNPSAQSGDWTVTTASGTVTISGTISGTTDIKLYLVEQA